MAENDAEMADSPAFGEDLQQIAQRLASLRQDLEGLAGDVTRTGSHQLDQMRSTADAAVAEFTAAIRRNPLTAIGIAAGVGFLYGVLRGH